MFIELLRPEWVLPNGANTNLMRLKLLSAPNLAYLLLNPTSRFMGRFATKGAGLTNLQIMTAPTDHWAADEVGLPFGAGLDLTNTTTQGGSNTPLYPYLRVRITGTIADGDTTVRLALACSAPIYGIQVLEALPGLPFKAGDDLIRGGFGMVTAL